MCTTSLASPVCFILSALYPSLANLLKVTPVRVLPFHCHCYQDDNNNTTKTSAAAANDVNGNNGAFTRCSSRKSLASNAAMLQWLEAQERAQQRLQVGIDSNAILLITGYRERHDGIALSVTKMT